MKTKMKKIQLLKHRIIEYKTPFEGTGLGADEIWSVEERKHWWSKWKPLAVIIDNKGKTVPKTMCWSDAFIRFINAEEVGCKECRFCYGRVNEAEYGYRRCRMRKEEGGNEMVITDSTFPCAIFSGKDFGMNLCKNCKFYRKENPFSNKKKCGVYYYIPDLKFSSGCSHFVENK